MKGSLICFEGLDGAGKTSISRLVSERLQNQKFKAIFVEKKSTQFSKDYITQRMTKLRHIIWEYGDDPIYELGDEHSLYILASWFAVLDKCKIRPFLSEGYIVIVDNWYYKFLSRFKLKQNLDFYHVKHCFSRLSSPDAVIFLDVSPKIAASRKENFSITETGKMHMDNQDIRSKKNELDNFIKFQSSVRKVLSSFALEQNWIRIKVDEKSIDEVAQEAFFQIQHKIKNNT